MNSALSSKALSNHKHTIDDITDALDPDTIVNSYVWKKYYGDPSLYSEETLTDVTIAIKKLAGNVILSNYSNISYGDRFSVTEGMLSLKNVLSIGSSSISVSSCSALLGKYIKAIGVYYYIPNDATFTETSSTSSGTTTYNIKVSTATKISADGIFLDFVADEDSATYPVNGTYDSDGLWYVYHKQLGEDVSVQTNVGLDTSDATATASDIASGKTAYADGEKITGNISTTTGTRTIAADSVSRTAVSGTSTTYYVNYQKLITSDMLLRSGSTLNVRSNVSNFGDATAADVAAGKTFTSSAGLKVTGTAEIGSNAVIEICSVTLKKVSGSYYPSDMYYTGVTTDGVCDAWSYTGLYSENNIQFSCIKGCYLILDCSGESVAGHNVTISDTNSAFLKTTYDSGWIIGIYKNAADTFSITVS